MEAAVVVAVPGVVVVVVVTAASVVAVVAVDAAVAAEFVVDAAVAAAALVVVFRVVIINVGAAVLGAVVPSHNLFASVSNVFPVA